MDLFTAHIIFAIVGGFAGALRDAIKHGSNGNVGLVLANLLVGVATAAASGASIPTHWSPFMALVAGIFAGSLGGYTLDLCYGILPSLMKDLAKAVVSRAGNISSTGEDEE